MRRGLVAAAVAGVVATAAAYLAVRAAGDRRGRPGRKGDDDHTDGDTGGDTDGDTGGDTGGDTHGATAVGGPVRGASRASRNLHLARLGGSTAASTVVHKAKRALASVDRKEELDAAFQLRTAEQVAEALGNMKGALMKLGQMASYLDQGLPEPVRQALAELQANAPPMAPDLARSTVEASLGTSIEAAFSSWDDRPLASASIGQVHRAVTVDGRPAAVKVQYPGVGEAIRADLDNAGLIFGAAGMLFPGLEPGPVVAELRARLLEELDYRLEARNQAEFADFYRDHPFIHVPDVVAHLSTDRVLTTELADGVRFAEAETWPQAERDLAAEAIYRFVFGSLYRMHAFNGDPHPGNYLFQPGGRVTFLDFGLVKHFDATDVDVLGRMVRSIVFDRDMPSYRRGLDEAGFLPLDAPFSDEQIEDYFGHFYDSVKEDGDVTITPAWSSESVRRFFDASGPHGEIMKAANVPPAFVIIQRINLGLYAVLGELNATANWRRIAEEIWPWIEAPPSTPLGEADAAWRAAKRATQKT